MSKEKTFFFFSLTALFLTMYLSQFSLALYIFLFSFACSHARSSPRLHCPQSHSLGILFLLTSRMASPCISSSFPSFLPFTLLTSIHNKCLDFASANFFFLRLSLRALEHSYSEMTSYLILPFQKVTLLIMQYYFTIHPASQLLFLPTIY